MAKRIPSIGGQFSAPSVTLTGCDPFPDCFEIVIAEHLLGDDVGCLGETSTPAVPAIPASYRSASRLVRSEADDGRQGMVYPRQMDSTSDVLAVIADMTARWNAKDAASFSGLFVDDATFTDVIGQTARGRAGIEAQHRFPFTRNMREAVLTVEQTHVRPLGPDASLVLLQWSTTRNLSLDGASAPDRRGNMLVVLERSAGTWAIVGVLNQDPMGIYGKQVAEAGGMSRIVGGPGGGSP